MSTPSIPEELRAACSDFPTGVTIATRLLPDGKPWGITLSSFTSVSLEPPVILICVNLRSTFLQGLTHGSRFAVNLLSRRQLDAASVFSRPNPDRFSSVSWREGPCGPPILTESLSSISCEVHETIQIGDHLVVFGRVLEVSRRAGTALVYLRSRFHLYGPEAMDGTAHQAS